MQPLSDSKAKANIAANLQRLLGAAGMSQRELSRRTGDPVMTLNAIVRGHSMPGAGVLGRVAEALGVALTRFWPLQKEKRAARLDMPYELAYEFWRWNCPETDCTRK